MNNPYQQYQTNSIMTASPQQLTLMLYNGAIKFCNLSLEGLEEKNYEKAHKYNLKIQDIIEELELTLNYKYPISKNLKEMYSIIKELLIDANIKKDFDKLLGVKELLIEFRDLWQQIMNS